MDALARFRQDRPTLLATMPSKIRTSDALDDIVRLHRAAVKADLEILGTEDVFFAVTRGLSHILTTNGYYEEAWFVRGRIRKPYPHHFDDRTASFSEFLTTTWPRISGIDEPAFQLDEGDIFRHADYFKSLPLFKDVAGQKSWGWWSEPARSSVSGAPFRLCDRCNRHFEEPSLDGLAAR